MICAIILAAGQSRRMGVQKLLLPFDGRTVIGRVAGEILRSPVERTIVVLGADAGRVAEVLAGQSLVFVTNPDPAGDMLSSVRCGLRETPAECTAILVALGDQPSITSGLITQVLDAFRISGRGIVVPVYRGRRGHPLLFSARYCREILAGYDHVGLRGLLRAHPEDVFELSATSPAVLADMDYPEDYRRELRRLSDDNARSPRSLDSDA